MSAVLRRLHGLLSTMHGQQALVLYRVIAGCTILLQLLAALPERHYLFGPNGVYPPELVRETATFGLFSLASTPWTFDLIYFGAIAITVVWTLGHLLPLTTLLVLLAWRSMHDQLPGLSDGGDNLTQLVLIYALACNLGGASRDGWWSRRPAWAQQLRAMVHNTGLLAIWIQIGLVYFVAGLTKLQGEAWRNGTALYYALSTEKFTIPEVAELLFEFPVLLTLLAYVTVGFQVGFPFLVALNGRSRQAALVVAVGFHLGIATVMGLTSFGLFMIAADLTLLSDGEISRAIARFESVRLGLWARLGLDKQNPQTMTRKPTT